MYGSKETSLKIIREKYNSISFSFTEKSRRLWAASEARAYGYGGIALVSQAIGISNKTIDKGLRELADNSDISEQGRVRKKGGGRKILDSQQGIISDLNEIILPHTIGDQESVLRWSSKSVRKICDELCALNHNVSFKTVSTLLKKLGYSLQSNVKKKEGKQNPDQEKREYRKLQE